MEEHVRPKNLSEKSIQRDTPAMYIDAAEHRACLILRRSRNNFLKSELVISITSILLLHRVADACTVLVGFSTGSAGRNDN